MTTAMVIAETPSRLDRERGRHVEALPHESISDGPLRVDAASREDRPRVRALVVQDADLGLGGGDAGLLAGAERHGERRLAALDHRHVWVLRPRRGAAFALVPSRPPAQRPSRAGCDAAAGASIRSGA